MDEALRRFVEIPLGVTDQARVIVQDGEQDRTDPLSLGPEHLERAVMEVEVPQPAHILALEAADLAESEVLPGADLPVTFLARALSGLPDQGLGGHEAAQGRVRRRHQIGMAFDLHGQVVEVKLVAPARVLFVLTA